MNQNKIKTTKDNLVLVVLFWSIYNDIIHEIQYRLNGHRNCIWWGKYDKEVREMPNSWECHGIDKFGFSVTFPLTVKISFYFLYYVDLVNICWNGLIDKWTSGITFFHWMMDCEFCWSITCMKCCLNWIRISIINFNYFNALNNYVYQSLMICKALSNTNVIWLWQFNNKHGDNSKL